MWIFMQVPFVFVFNWQIVFKYIVSRLPWLHNPPEIFSHAQLTLKGALYMFHYIKCKFSEKVKDGNWHFQ